MNTPAAPTIVIDASVSLAWLLSEPDNSAALQHLFLQAFRRQCTVLVPALWHWECANVLLGMVKRKTIQLPQVLGYLELMRHANPQTDDMPNEHIQHATIALAQVAQLSYYDATYVELALRRKAQLATRDTKMKNADKNLGVTCLPL